MPTYLIQLPNGESIQLRCTQFELRKKISERLLNIPYGQIIILDHSNQLYELNQSLVETQQANGTTLIQYRVFDLQKLITEWFNRGSLIQGQKLNIKKMEEAVEKLQQQQLLEKEELIKEKNQESQQNSQKYAQLEQQLNQQISQLQSELKECNNQHAKDLGALQQQMIRDKQNFDSQKINYDKEIANLKQQLIDSEKIKNQLQNGYNQLQVDNNSLKQQFEQNSIQWQQYAQNQQSYIQNLAYQEQVNKEALKNEQKTISDLQEKLKKEQQQKQQYKGELDEARNLIAQLEQKISEQSKSSQKQQSIIEALQKQIKELEQESQQQLVAKIQACENLQLDINNKKQELKQMFSEKQQLQLQLENQKNDFLQQKAANEKKYQTAIRELKEQAKIKEQNNNKAAESFYSSIQQKDAEQIAQLQSQLEQSIKQYQKDIEVAQKQLNMEKQTFEQERTNLQKQLTEISSQLQNSKAQNEQLQNDYDQAQERSKNEIDQLKQQLEQHQMQFQNYFQQCAQMMQNQFNDLQTKETFCQELQQQIQDLEQKHKQELNERNKQVNLQKEEAQETISQYEQQVIIQQQQCQKLKKQIDMLQRKISEEEEERQQIEKNGVNVNVTVQNQQIDINRKRNEIQQLTIQRDDLINELQNQKNAYTQSLKTNEKRYQDRIEELEAQLKYTEEQNKKLQNQLDQQILNNNQLKQKNQQCNQTIEQMSAQMNKFQQDLENQGNEKNSLYHDKTKLDQEKQFSLKKIEEMTKLYEQAKQQNYNLEAEKTALRGQIQNLDVDCSTLNSKLTEIERQKDQYLNQCKKMAVELQNAQQLYLKETEKLIVLRQVSQAKIAKAIQNFGEQKIYEKLSSPLEKIMQSKFKINEFNKDPNSQLDKTNYNLHEIGLDNNKFNQYVKQGKFFLIDECFIYTDRKQITGQRSIQVSAESEFYKGYLIKIEETQEESLKNRTILRKDLKLQSNASATKEDAARLANNNIFCAWLLQQFNRDLAAAKLQTMGYAIQRQFVLEHKEKKEFYYCELVEEGEYKKINGGKFVPQNEDVHQYFNAFSMYSHNYFQNELMITNFQICGNYIHDMIVNTNQKGLFSLLDQGAPEYLQFTDIISKLLPQILAKFWNQNLRAIAQNALVA